MTIAIADLPEVAVSANLRLRDAGRSYDGVASAEDNEILRETMPPFVDMVRERLPTKQRRSGPPRWS